MPPAEGMNRPLSEPSVDRGMQSCPHTETHPMGEAPAMVVMGWAAEVGLRVPSRHRRSLEVVRGWRAQAVTGSARAVGVSGGGGASRQARTAVASLVGV